MSVGAESTTIEVPIAGMDCADCTRSVQQAIAALPGVQSADVLLAGQSFRLARDRVGAEVVQHLERVDRTLLAGASGPVLGAALREAGLVSGSTQGIESVETDLGEYIVQLAGEAPSHIIAPAVHKTIAEVAFACGFESLATFYRLFSASESMTPGDYRARLA